MNPAECLGSVTKCSAFAAHTRELIARDLDPSEDEDQVAQAREKLFHACVFSRLTAFMICVNSLHT